MRALTVRGVPKELTDALEREKRTRGASLNQTVIDLLAQALGVRGDRSNGLASQAGTWTDAEAEEFDRALSAFEEVDPDLWR